MSRLCPQPAADCGIKVSIKFIGSIQVRKQCVHTDEFARCLIRMFERVCRIWTYKFSHKVVALKYPSAFRPQAPPKCGSLVGPSLFPSISARIAMVQCGSAFRLRRLAQSVVSAFGHHFSLQFFQCRVFDISRCTSTALARTIPTMFRRYHPCNAKPAL